MNRFFSTASAVGKNMFNSMGWTSVPTIVSQEITRKRMSQAGYFLVGNMERGQMVRIPVKKSRKFSPGPLIVSDNNYEKSYRDEQASLKNLVSQRSTWPFFLTAHFKYMHYPLVDEINPDAEWDYFLSAEEKSRVSEYRSHPEKHLEKTPLLLYLFHEPQFLLKDPSVRGIDVDPERPRDLRKLAGLINEPSMLRRWRESAGFADDLKLIDKIYRANLRYFDAKVLGPALELFGDKELQRNTIVIVMGDHGESRMEHGDFGHGDSLFDPALQIPFAIRFPDYRGKPVIIEEQMQMAWMAELVADLLDKKIQGPDGLHSFVRARAEEPMAIRNCNNDQNGLRIANRYKFIRDLASGKRLVFDLQKDPAEKVDISASQIGVAQNLEDMFWKHYERFSQIPVHHCVSWDGKESGNSRKSQKDKRSARFQPLQLGEAYE